MTKLHNSVFQFKGHKICLGLRLVKQQGHAEQALRLSSTSFNWMYNIMFPSLCPFLHHVAALGFTPASPQMGSILEENKESQKCLPSPCFYHSLFFSATWIHSTWSNSHKINFCIGTSKYWSLIGKYLQRILRMTTYELLLFVQPRNEQVDLRNLAQGRLKVECWH